MDFRRSLIFLIVVFRDRHRFTSKIFASRLQEYYDIHAAASKMLPNKVKRKLISNDLARLYKMGYLNRKRVKREAITSSGKQCFRGYEYYYSISKQGIRYFAFLVRGKPPKRKSDYEWLNEISLNGKMLDVMKTEHPLQMLEVIKLHHDIEDGRSKKPRGGWYNRFPDKRNFQLMQEYFTARVILDKNGIDFSKAKLMVEMEMEIDNEVDYSTFVTNYVSNMIKNNPEGYDLLKDLLDQQTM